MTFAPNSDGDYMRPKYQPHEALQILLALWPLGQGRIGWGPVAGTVFVTVYGKDYYGSTFNEAIEAAKNELP